MANDGELQIVHSILKGSRPAMADLYHRHIGYLAAVCSRYISSDEDVRDILQTSFMKIISSLDKFEWRGPGSLRAWMTRITVNESLKFLRENEKTRKMFEGYVPEDEVVEEPDTDNLSADVIQGMIRELPDGYRTVFNLYVFEEKSHKKIAAMLGITESTSASQFHRAKALLASKIREYRKKHDM